MSEEIVFYCPHCSAGLLASLENIGAKVQCAQCQEKFILNEDQQAVTAKNTSPTAKRLTHKRKPSSRRTSRKAPKKKKSKVLVIFSFLLICTALLYWKFKTKLDLSDQQKIAKSSTTLNSDEATDTANSVQYTRTEIPLDSWAKQIDSKPFIELRRELKKELASLDVQQIQADEKKLLQLRRHELIRACGDKNLDKLCKKKQGKEFLQRLLSDGVWLDRLMGSGPIPRAYRSVEHLYIIWKYDKECEDPFYQKLATAICLKHTSDSDINYYLVKRFQRMKQAHKDLKFHKSFNDLDTREMRFTVDSRLADDHFQFMVNDRSQPRSKAWRNCWTCRYRQRNSFGDSIQGRHFYAPWHYAYNWSENIRINGGVCGSLSKFGTSAAQAQGIPAMPAGQPGHLAHVIRDGNKKWKVAYSVKWPTRPAHAFWGHKYTYLNLMEETFADITKVRHALYAAWVARMHLPEKIDIQFKRCKVYRYSRNPGKLPDFTTLEAVEDMACDKINVYGHSGRKKKFGLVYTGKFTLQNSAQYQVLLKGNDFSRLLIDGIEIGRASAKGDYEKLIQLKAGTHNFQLEMSEGANRAYVNFYLNQKIAKDSKALIAYDEALKRSPTHVGLWNEYKKVFVKVHEDSPENLKQFSLRAATALQQHQEAAWYTITDKTLFNGLNDQQRVAQLASLHRVLDHAKVKAYQHYPMGGILRGQAALVSSVKARVDLFKEMSNIHKKSPLYFKAVCNWGEHLGKTELASEYNRILAELYNDKENQAFLDHGIRKNILEAAEKQDNDNFQYFSKIAEKGLKNDKRADLPKFKHFSGQNLGANGSLRLIGKTCKWDSPKLHRSVLADEKKGGLFTTNRHDSSWVEVKLQGKGLLSGIVIINHTSRPDRAVPFIVEVSSDGEKWKKIYKSSKQRDHWRINLQKKRIKANYVRVKSLQKNEHLHLRGIFIYGKKLF